MCLAAVACGKRFFFYFWHWTYAGEKYIRRMHSLHFNLKRKWGGKQEKSLLGILNCIYDGRMFISFDIQLGILSTCPFLLRRSLLFQHSPKNGLPGYKPNGIKGANEYGSGDRKKAACVK